MTKEEFYAKYGDVEVKFYGYYKFTFTFTTILADGSLLEVECGGSSDDIYKLSVVAGFSETVLSLQPKAGAVFLNGKEVEGFYDY